MKKLLIILFGMVLCSCAIHTARLGDESKIYAPVEMEQVKVYYKYTPTYCQAEQLAIIDGPSSWSWTFVWKWNLANTIEDFKEEAAEYGADFIVIRKWYKSAFWNDKMIDFAIAYKCVEQKEGKTYRRNSI